MKNLLRFYDNHGGVVFRYQVPEDDWDLAKGGNAVAVDMADSGKTVVIPFSSFCYMTIDVIEEDQ